MNRFGCGLLALFLIVGAGFALLVRKTEEAAIPAEPGAAASIAPSGLAIPVAGVSGDRLVDTFGDARGERTHGALDVMAPRGTPVVAAMPGTVEKIFESEAGGHTVYVRSADRRWLQYFAHLDGYAPGLREGMYVARGQPIGAVGATGNADPAGPHLHFELRRMAPGEKWYQGRGINPYPLLAGSVAAR